MNAIGVAPCTRISLTLWLTRSSPTVSNRPACSATSTLVPTPSVLSTSVGPAACRPESAPSRRRRRPSGGQRRPGAFDERADARLGRVGALPGPRLRRRTAGSRQRLRQLDVREVRKARTRVSTSASVTPRSHGCRTARPRTTHGGAVHHRPPETVIGHRAGPREVGHEPAGKGVARARGIEDVLQGKGRHVEGARRRRSAARRARPA